MQFRGALCGFHMYYNVKCLIKALLAKSKYEQLLHILDLQSAKNFWLHHKHCVELLEKCTNTHYVSKADKVSLNSQGPLDRSHLTYLMQVDPQLRELVYNKSNVAVFVTTLEYSFGLLHRTPEQVVEIHEQVTNFLSVQTHPAVLVIFLGVVNHWVAIVAKRPNMSKLTNK